MTRKNNSLLVACLILAFFLFSPLVARAEESKDPCELNLQVSPAQLRCNTSTCSVPNATQISCDGVTFTGIDKKCEKQIDCSGYSGMAGGRCANGKCYLDETGFQVVQKQQTLPVVGIKSDLEIFPPKTNIKIPTLSDNFSDVSKNTVEESDGTYLLLPWIGEYIGAIYNFALGVVSIIAVIMIIIQGAKVVVSAGGSAKSEAYKRITQAVIGLVIMWGSYVILYTINPELVKFKSLKVLYIEGENIDEIEFNEDNTWDETTVFNGNIVPVTFSDNFTHASNPGPDGTLSNEQIAGLADATILPDGSKLDRCFLWAGVRKESKSVQRVGVDENVTKTTDKQGNPAKIAARRQFIMSGVKYSSTTFNTKDLWGPDTPNCSSSDNPYPKGKLVKLPDPNVEYSNCHNDARTADGYKIFNDAPGTGDFTKNPKKDSPPDYGYDWRFSKGLGLRQITINPAKRPVKVKGPNGDEWAIKLGESFYTVTDLLSLEGSTRALIDWHLQKFKRKDCQTAHTNRDLRAMWFCMGLGEASVGRAIDMYNKCPFPKYYH